MKLLSQDLWTHKTLDEERNLDKDEDEIPKGHLNGDDLPHISEIDGSLSG